MSDLSQESPSAVAELDIARVLVSEEEPEPELPEIQARRFRTFWLLIGAGWLSTNLGYSLTELPMRFALKDDMHKAASAVSFFFFATQFTNYIKPLAGILTDYVPLFGTRRRHYLLISLTACGVMWLLLGLVPKSYAAWFGTYAFLHIFIVFISTTLGGLMVEGGSRFRATGRLSAQRIGIFRMATLVGAPIGGWLATKDFRIAAAIAAGFHFILLPLYFGRIRESGKAQLDADAIERVKAQARELMRSKTLWAAAGLIVLVIAAPGYGTALLYYQTDTLHFSKPLIGRLGLVDGACGVVGALLFSLICRRFPLKPLIVGGILLHIVAALLYLNLRTPLSAYLIHGLYSAAQTLALLPLYDLAMRGTPRGSEAIGYSIMMSVWNVTNGLSDLLGSWMFSNGLSLPALIFMNAGTTALVLFAVPFLPRVLTDRKEGEPSA